MSDSSFSPSSSTSRFDASFRRPARWWMVCLPIGLLGTLVLFSGLRALDVAPGVAISLAGIIALLLPVLWHFIAERQRRQGPVSVVPTADRLALRAGAVSAVVVAATLAAVGPRTAGQRLITLSRGLTAAKPAAPPAAPEPTPLVSKTPARHELESFIPADAGLVVALSGPTMAGQLLTKQDGPLKKSIAALGKCQIAVERALVLYATKDRDTRMIVVRAPGITDPRNLYCLVGVLGSDGVTLNIASDSAPVRVEISGVGARPLKFVGIDAQTLMMVDDAWTKTASKKLFVGSEATQGPLGPIIARIDRGVGLWSAALSQSTPGHDPVDLLFEASAQDTTVRLHASAALPAGSPARADFDARVPTSFVAALPAGALNQSVEGFVRIVSALAGGLPAEPPAGQPPGR